MMKVYWEELERHWLLGEARWWEGVMAEMSEGWGFVGKAQSKTLGVTRSVEFEIVSIISFA